MGPVQPRSMQDMLPVRDAISRPRHGQSFHDLIGKIGTNAEGDADAGRTACITENDRIIGDVKVPQNAGGSAGLRFTDSGEAIRFSRSRPSPARDDAQTGLPIKTKTRLHRP